MCRLRLESFLTGDDYYHIHRNTIKTRGFNEEHNHTFCEIFWIESGSGFHFLNNRKIKLEKNELSIVRPDDAHSFSSSNSLQFVNIAFPVESLHFFCGRYNYQLMNRIDTPLQWSLNSSHMDSLEGLVSTLMNRENNPISLEAFLINLFAVLDESNSSLLYGGREKIFLKPPVVDTFLNLLADNNNLDKNLDKLSELAGYSREHLSRQTKSYTNKTPTQLIREARVKYAIRQLSINKESILDISLFCGYSSLSQFYKIFKEATGYTPSRYRKNNIRIIGSRL